MNVNIPFSKLRLSDENSRQDETDLKITQLAADIAAKGLLQNLIVEPLDRPKGHYGVIAGGRRFRAIKHNIEAGVFPKTYEVVCKIKDTGSLSSEISFSENFQRENMTPADEIQAFSKLVADGLDSATIAKRFGLDKRNVDARLRLSHVAPEILDALRAGKVSLNHVKAYAQAPNIEAQLHAFNNYKFWSHEQLYRHFTSDTVSGKSEIAKFITEATYREAGGRVELDLFSDDGAIWLDTDIAHQLASDAMNAHAKALVERDKLAWVRPILGPRVTYEDSQKVQLVHIPNREMTDAEQARYDELQEQYSIVAQRHDQAEEDSEEERLAAAELEAIDKQLDELTPGPIELSDEVLGRLGRFLVIENGKPTYDPRYYCEERININGQGEIVTPSTIRDNIRNTGTSPDGLGIPGDEDETSKPSLSAKLADELRLQRRDVLAAHLASNPSAAMNYMLFSLALAKMSHSGSRAGTTISPGSPQDGMNEYPKGDANEHLSAVFDSLNTDWYNHSDITLRFDAFVQISDDEKAAWVAYIMATTLTAIGSYGMSPDYSLQAHIAGLLQVDFAAMWRPTAANYFDRVKKDVILDALEDIGGETLRLRHAGAKKRELAASAEAIFSGRAILDPDMKEKALTWIPAEMSFATEMAANTRRIEAGEGDPLDGTDDNSDSGMTDHDDPFGADDDDSDLNADTNEGDDSDLEEPTTNNEHFAGVPGDIEPEHSTENV